MNKKGVIPRDILISLILFSMVVIGMSLVIGSIYPSYGSTSVNMPSSFNQMDKMTTDLSTMQTKIEASGASPVGFLEYISVGAWAALKLTTNSIGITTSMLTDVGEEYGVPSIPFIYGFIGIFTIVVIFGIISAIFRSKV